MFITGLIITAISAIGGSILGLDAIGKMDEARQIAQTANDSYKRKTKKLNECKSHTKNEVETLYNIQRAIYNDSITNFIIIYNEFHFIKELKDLSLEKHCVYVIPYNSIIDTNNPVKNESFGFDIAFGIGTGTLIGLGTTGLVSLLGTASTGTAISALTGIYAKSALLAALGGGAKAAGGFGMLGGSFMLAGLIIGPALGMGGLLMNGKANNALEEANRFANEVNNANSEMNKIIILLSKIDSVVNDIMKIICELDLKLKNNLPLMKEFKLHKTKFFEKIPFWLTFKKAPDNILFRNERKFIKKNSLFAKKLIELFEMPIVMNDESINANCQNIIYSGYKILKN